MGSFIFIILDVNINITDSHFYNGMASYGGAIYISGQSTILIQSSVFSENLAEFYGGAIFANGFQNITIIGGTIM